MTDRRNVQGDQPWWIPQDKKINIARLQMAILRGDFIYGKDHVRHLKDNDEIQDYPIFKD